MLTIRLAISSLELMTRCTIGASLPGLLVLTLGFTSPIGLASPPPGYLEEQIRTLRPQLNSTLASKATFAHSARGYQPEAVAAVAPAGLKPEEAQGWIAFTRLHRGDGFAPTFPEHYESGIEVHGNAMTILLRPLGANAAPARIEDGKLVYHDAYTSTDSLTVVTENRSEEFLVLRDRNAPQRFEYRRR